MEQHYRTNNNINVYAYPSPHLHSFCLRLYVKAGVLYEGEKENGITHFLEHIFFRNLGGMTQEEIYRKIDHMGVTFNGETSKEYMHFYFTGVPKHFNECAEMIAKLLAPLSATKADVDMERRRIKCEIREDDKAASIIYLSDQRVWAGTPLTRLVTGTASSIEHITLKKLKEKQEHIFTSDNLFFYVTGCCTEENIAHLCKQIEQYEVKETSTIRENIAPLPEKFSNRNAAVSVKDNKYTYVSLSFDMQSGRYTIAETDLLYEILFAGVSGRFQKRLSEETGMIYDFDSWLELYCNIGHIFVSYEIQPEKIYESIELAVQVFKSMKDSITEDDFKRVVPNYVDNADMDLDDPQNLNYLMAYYNHILNRKEKSIEEIKQTYLAVTPQRMLQIAGEIFTSSNLVVTIKGNKRKIKPEKVRELLLQLD